MAEEKETSNAQGQPAEAPGGSGPGNNDNAAKKNGSKKKRAAFILLILILVGGATATYWWFKAKTDVSTDDAFIDSHVYQISPRVPGHVKGVYVDDNQHVKKGDLLVALDPTDYIAKVRDAEYAVKAAENEVSSNYAQLGSARTQVNLARARFELAGKNLKRGEELFKKGIIAKQDLDNLVTEQKVSASQLRNSEEAVKKAEADIGLLVQGGKAANVAQKKAQLEQARLNLQYTDIYAPAEGYITNKSVEAGNNVSPGQPLMAVVRLDDIWITANYKETQLTYMRRGQKVDFTVDAYPGKTFRGTVDSIMAGTGAAFSLLPPENATGNYVKIVQRVPVKMDIDQSSDPDHLLRVGMSVVPTVRTGKTFGEVVRNIFR